MAARPPGRWPQAAVPQAAILEPSEPGGGLPLPRLLVHLGRRGAGFRPGILVNHATAYKRLRTCPIG
jgi:hypothetical protein